MRNLISAYQDQSPERNPLAESLGDYLTLGKMAARHLPSLNTVGLALAAFDTIAILSLTMLNILHPRVMPSDREVDAVIGQVVAEHFKGQKLTKDQVKIVREKVFNKLQNPPKALKKESNPYSPSLKNDIKNNAKIGAGLGLIGGSLAHAANPLKLADFAATRGVGLGKVALATTLAGGALGVGAGVTKTAARHIGEVYDQHKSGEDHSGDPEWKMVFGKWVKKKSAVKESLVSIYEAKAGERKSKLNKSLPKIGKIGSTAHHGNDKSHPGHNSLSSPKKDTDILGRSTIYDPEQVIAKNMGGGNLPSVYDHKYAQFLGKEDAQHSYSRFAKGFEQAEEEKTFKQKAKEVAIMAGKQAVTVASFKLTQALVALFIAIVARKVIKSGLFTVGLATDTSRAVVEQAAIMSIAPFAQQLKAPIDQVTKEVVKAKGVIVLGVLSTISKDLHNYHQDHKSAKELGIGSPMGIVGAKVIDVNPLAHPSKWNAMPKYYSKGLVKAPTADSYKLNKAGEFLAKSSERYAKLRLDRVVAEEKKKSRDNPHMLVNDYSASDTNTTKVRDKPMPESLRKGWPTSHPGHPSHPDNDAYMAGKYKDQDWVDARRGKVDPDKAKNGPLTTLRLSPKKESVSPLVVAYFEAKVSYNPTKKLIKSQKDTAKLIKQQRIDQEKLRKSQEKIELIKARAVAKVQAKQITNQSKQNLKDVKKANLNPSIPFKQTVKTSFIRGALAGIENSMTKIVNEIAARALSTLSLGTISVGDARRNFGLTLGDESSTTNLADVQKMAKADEDKLVEILWHKCMVGDTIGDEELRNRIRNKLETMPEYNAKTKIEQIREIDYQMTELKRDKNFRENFKHLIREQVRKFGKHIPMSASAKEHDAIRYEKTHDKHGVISALANHNQNPPGVQQVIDDEEAKERLKLKLMEVNVEAIQIAKDKERLINWLVKNPNQFLSKEVTKRSVLDMNKEELVSLAEQIIDHANTNSVFYEKVMKSIKFRIAYEKGLKKEEIEKLL